MEVAGGDEAAFADLLRRFMSHYEDGVGGLDASLATGQREPARLMVHSLKGAAAAIGAVALRERAASLEAKLAPAAITQSLRLLAFDLENDLVHMVAALHDVLPAQAEPERHADAVVMSAAQLGQALETLALLLACGDFAAQRFYRDIAPDVRAAFGSAAGELGRAMRQRDDEAALELVRQLQARRNAQPVVDEMP